MTKLQKRLYSLSLFIWLFFSIPRIWWMMEKRHRTSEIHKRKNTWKWKQNPSNSLSSFRITEFRINICSTIVINAISYCDCLQFDLTWRLSIHEMKTSLFQLSCVRVGARVSTIDCEMEIVVRKYACLNTKLKLGFRLFIQSAVTFFGAFSK